VAQAEARLHHELRQIVRQRAGPHVAAHLATGHPRALGPHRFPVALAERAFVERHAHGSHATEEGTALTIG
jgi:hypothetical protein